MAIVLNNIPNQRQAISLSLSPTGDTTNLPAQCGTLNQERTYYDGIYRSLGQEMATTTFCNL